MKKIEYNKVYGDEKLNWQYKKIGEGEKCIKLLVVCQEEDEDIEEKIIFIRNDEIYFQNEKMIQLLLDHKANKSIIDKQGKTAFEYAVSTKNELIINLFK